MMERSTKFLSLTGWSGIMAGVYALAGAYFAYKLSYSNKGEVIYNTIDRQEISGSVIMLFLLALVVLFLAICTHRHL